MTMHRPDTYPDHKHSWYRWKRKQEGCTICGLQREKINGRWKYWRVWC
jgi:hypothetical protein